MAKVHDEIKQMRDMLISVNPTINEEQIKAVLLQKFAQKDIDVALTVAKEIDEDSEEAKYQRKLQHIDQFCRPFIRIYQYTNEHMKYLLKDPSKNLWERYEDDLAFTSFVYQKMQDENWPVVQSAYATTLWKDWILQRDSKFAEPPRAFCNHLENDPCLAKMSIAPQAGECPTFKEWLTTLSDPGAFCAWVWAVVLGNKVYQGRQSLWMYGAGEDGKSAILEIFGLQIFGNAYKSIGKTSGDSRFDAAHLENSRLIANPDTNNPTELLNGFNKSLSGGDQVKIEHKGKPARFGAIHAMLWINSNFKPWVLDARHSISRILPIEITPKEVKDEDRLLFKPNIIKELPHILDYCREQYELLCPDNVKIRTNAATESFIKLCVSETQESELEIMDQLKLELNSESSITRDELSRLRETLKISSNSQEWKKFVEYLKRNKCKQTTKNGVKIWIGLGKVKKTQLSVLPTIT